MTTSNNSEAAEAAEASGKDEAAALALAESEAECKALREALDECNKTISNQEHDIAAFNVQLQKRNVECFQLERALTESKSKVQKLAVLLESRK